MGGRGNGAARNSTVTDEFTGMLGKRTAVNAAEKMQQLLKGEPSPYNRNLIKSVVNPEYNPLRKDKYSKNCAICTVATALQLKGYDVVANGRDKDVWRGTPDVFEIDYTNKGNYIMGTHKDYSDYTPNTVKNKDGLYQFYDKKSGDFIKGVQIMPDTASEAYRVIQDKVKSWGNGAFGEMSVSWKTGGAHSVLIYNDHGTAKVYDSQSHKKIGNLGSYLERTNVGMTQIVRLDNARVKAEMQTGGGYYVLNKMFKRRDGKKITDPRNFK